MNTRRIQIALLALIFGTLFSPLALIILNRVKAEPGAISRLTTSPLSGTVDESGARPRLTPRSWWNGAFQPSYSTWFGENFPTRDLMVRASNELDFDLFHLTRTKDGDLTIGKGDYLYARQYINDYINVRPVVSPSRMAKVVGDIAELKARLAKRRVPFAIFITPSKATVYPQYIPDAFLRARTGAPRSYDEIIPLLRSAGVPFVDSPALMETAKSSTPPGSLLFCQGGLHWTYWGAFLATRQLLATLSAQRGNDLPTLNCASVPIDNKATDREDADLADLLNVAIPRQNYPIPHPVVTRSPAGRAVLKKLVVVGGSFDWKPLRILDSENIFEKIDFYFYYHQYRFSFPQKTKEPVDVNKIDWPNKIANADAIVLEINESAMSDSDTHYAAFLDDALRHINADGSCH